MTILTRATQEDLSVIMALETQAFPQGWSAQVWAEEIEHHYVVVADDAGVISMGMVSETADLRRVIVAESRRHQGLGSLLLDHGRSWALDQGAEEIFLEVSQGNEAAISVYERNGFEILATRHDYYRPGEDALVYRWVPQLEETHKEESCPNR